ncbi:MAG: hypothetical protein LBO03_07735 [Acidaminococcales bacterium]|jgi:hypothetical protein|nr:hypothetical protein [Acidaminococcales bacterium]
MRNVAKFKKKSRHLPFGFPSGETAFPWPGARRAAVFLCAAGLLALSAPAYAGTVTQSAETSTSTPGDLRDAASYGSAVTFSVPGVMFAHDAAAVSVNAGITVIRGGLISGFMTRISSLNADILRQADLRTDTALSSLTLNSDVLPFAQPALTAGMTYIRGDETPRTLGLPPFNNARWLTIDNKLNLENLHFDAVKITNEFDSVSAGGMTNGLIGNTSSHTNDIKFGDLTGNAFTGIDITFIGHEDTHYLAGGGLIGFRATGESSPPSASVDVGDITGNVFRGIKVTTTFSISNPTESAYLEGGGLIGLDAVSSPSNVPGHALLQSLNYNLFTGIAIDSGDIILGGGLVGVNNNSRDIGGKDVTYARIVDVRGNVFGNNNLGDITVKAGYSLRGGGVLGINGLSNAAVKLDYLADNIFAGVAVDVGSYLRGGGLVGLNTNYNDGKSPDPGPDPDYPINASTGSVYGNLFINSSVAVGTRDNGSGGFLGGNLEGGGVVGLRSNAGYTEMLSLRNNIFYNLDVTTHAETSPTASLSNKGDLLGGGVVGLSSKQYVTLDTADNNWFSGINVDIGRNLFGGGLIGTYAEKQAIKGGADSIIGALENNTFRASRVSAAESLRGGGVAGVYATDTVSAGNVLAGIGFFSGNLFYDGIEVKARDLTGGGVVGVYSNDGGAAILSVQNNVFGDKDSFGALKVTTERYIAGGGVLGVYSGNNIAYINEIAGNGFFGAQITAGTYIDGGGLIGATGLTGSAAGHGLGLLNRNAFVDNEVTAENGQIMGGAVYSYGLAAPLEIRDSEFRNNTFTSVVNDTSLKYDTIPSAKVYGTVTVDTGLDLGAPHTNALTLSATAGKMTSFVNNGIVEHNGPGPIPTVPTRYNSLYFGVVDGYTTDDSTGNIATVPDAADSDAALIVQAEAGGVVLLFDPIAVNQNNGKTFSMRVTGNGVFLWGGDNTFALDGANGTVALEGGSNTVFINNELSGNRAFTLDGGGGKAPFAFTLNSGAALLVMGYNKMNVSSANFAGNVTFNIDNGDGFGKLSALGDDSGAASASGGALLAFTDPLANNVDVTGAKVSLSNFRAGDPLTMGDVFYLMDTGAGNAQVAGADALTNDQNQSGQYTAYARQGMTRGYNFIIDDKPDGTNRSPYLVARLYSSGPAPGARIINEGRIAGLAFVSNSAGWLADHSYESADLNIREKEGGWEYASFGGADAGWQRIETGSHLDLASSHLMLGRTAKRVREDGSLLYGGFVDAGFGHYSARGNFGDDGRVSGRGNLRAVGLGFMTRRVRPDGLRLEASLRGGLLENRFRSYELTDVDGNIARYDVRVPYFGAHIGIGKEKKLNEKDTFDLLLRYYYARQNGKSITLHTDERVDFAADDSHRLRLGTRFTRKKNDYRYWYVGAALEYEFAGKSRGVADGQYRLGEPDMGGLTGIVEVGGIAKPKPDSRFSAEYGVQFYAGKRGGLSGGIRLSWAF